VRPPSLLKALADPALFACHFRGASWAAWKVFLAALTAGPMDEPAMALYRQCTGRTAPPTAPFSEACLVVGRRGGKSRVLALIAVFLACFRDYTPHLAPGEVATIAVLASNRSQARSIFRFVSGLLKAVEPLAAMIETETGEFIGLSNRVVIEISTASFRTTRGYSFAAVLCDEIAFWRSDESSANPDTEILRALRPGMASIPGSILLLASLHRALANVGRELLRLKPESAALNPIPEQSLEHGAFCWGPGGRVTHALRSYLPGCTTE